VGHPHPEADGDLRVAWLRTADAGGSVHSMLLPPGTDRTAEEVVAALTPDEYVSGLDLGTNGEDVVLAWVSDTFGPQGGRVRTAERAGGASSWSVRDAATGRTIDSQNVSAVAAIGAAGDAIVAWVSPHDETLPFNEQRDVVWSAHRPAGQAWTAAARLPEPADGLYGLFPRVAVGAGGTFHAIWNEERPGSRRGVAYTTTEPLPADTLGPDVTITTPSIGQRFTRGADVKAAYTCTDETLIATCTGTVPNGARIDTSTDGEHQFTVVATDAAGHAQTRTHGYVVVAPATGGDTPADQQAPPVVPQPPLGYHELKPPVQGAPAQKTSQQLAQLKFDTPAIGAVKAAPAKIKGSGLLGGKPVSLPVKPITPNVDVRGGFVVAPGSANLISDNGLGLISDNGLGLLGAAGGNLLGPAGGNLIGPAGGNLLGAAGGNLLGPAGGNLARAAAKRKPKLTVLAKGAKFFPAPKAGKLPLKLSKAGRAALRRAFRKRGKQRLKVVYVVGFTERGGDLPTVVTARQITIRE
jgi:hypothetical protein